MWTFQQKILKSDRIYQFSLFQNKKQITYAQVISLWQHDKAFRNFWLELLTNIQMEAYFWETPPISRSTCDQLFEFVIINSPQLAKVRPDFNSFKQHFKSTTQEVVTFLNLRKDALLVAPCPIANTLGYSHFASFIRTSFQSQQHLFWQTVGCQLQRRLDNLANEKQMVWVSTSGLGVYWLHIRLDSIPKYYRFKPYKYQ